jgi:hypothetical protein
MQKNEYANVYKSFVVIKKKKITLWNKRLNNIFNKINQVLYIQINTKKQFLTLQCKYDTKLNFNI